MGRLTEIPLLEVIRRVGRPDLSHIRLPDPGKLKDWHKPRRKTDVRTLLLAGLAGAAIAFFLDPDRGRRRRKVGGDRVAAAFRRTGARAGRLARHVSSDSRGLASRMTHRGAADEREIDDATLTQKVQSLIFRDPGVPKGQVNVNVERGIVVLRGEVDRPEQILQLENETRKIPGVRGVESFLHLKA